MPQTSIIREDVLRRKPDGTVKVPWTCFFEYTDREGVKRIAKGRRFIVQETAYDLFPVGVLVAVLGRSRRTLYVWERDFGFPPAMWRVRDDRNCNRWYSRAQLEYVRAVYQQMGCLQGESRALLRQFITAVRMHFHTIDAPIKERHGG